MFGVFHKAGAYKGAHGITTYSLYLKVVLVLTLPILWFLAVGRYGWSDTDDGFILSYSWRIANRELPYKDFIYVRPPLSPLLHSLWFAIVPTNYVYAWTRFIVILQIEVYCLLGTFVLCKHVGVFQWISKGWFVIAIASFFASVSQFTPMAWHTVDGIFFTVLSLVFLVQYAGPWTTALCAVLICVAAMTKQSFYPMPLLVLLYLTLAQRYRDVAVYVLTVCMVAILSYTALNKFEMWQEFLNQTLGASSPQEAIQAGIVSYLLYGGRFFLAFCLICFCWKFMIPRGAGPLSGPQYLLLYFAMTIGLYSAVLAITKGWVSSAPLGAFHFLFIAAFLFSLMLWFRQRNKAIIMFLFLMVSWCASISWGFRTPALFSPPLLLGGMCCAQWLTGNESSMEGERRMVRYVFVGVLVVALLGSIHPYRDLDGRLSHTCKLGDVDRKLIFIVSGPNTCSKLTEFKKWSAELNGRIIVLPAFPLANFLLGQRSPMPLDWPMSIEMGPAYQKANKRLEENVDYVLLEKGAAKAFNHTRWHVPFIERVKKEWEETAEGRWYAIYKNPSTTHGVER